VNLKRLSISNLQQINELYRRCFQDQIEDDFFEWKYFSTFQSETIVLGLFEGTQLIASGALLYEVLLKDDKVLKTLRCTDLMTHPDYRGRGASRKIAGGLNEFLAKSNVDVVYTMCSKIATKSFFKTGWKFEKEIFYYFKPRFFSLFSSSIKDESKETSTLEAICKVYKLNYSNKAYLNFIKWRFANPKYKYYLISNEDEFIVYTINNNILFVIDFKVNGFAFLKNLDKLVIENNYRGIVVLSSCSQIQNLKFSFLNGYLINKFNFGPLKSLLDFNVLKEGERFKDVYSINYDDV